jgi:hypothetical protein
MERLHQEGAGRCVDRGTAEGGHGAAPAGRRRGACVRTARDVSTRRDVGLPDFKLALFKLSFLQKIE